MPVRDYIKRPVTVQAIQWTGDNAPEVKAFLNGAYYLHRITHGQLVFSGQPHDGQLTANVGDYVVRGVEGEFYPCKDTIFRKTYDRKRPPPSTWAEIGYDDQRRTPPHGDTLGDMVTP